MSFLGYGRGLWAKFFQRTQLEREIEEELRAHIELRAVDLARTGLSEKEAGRRARIEFGGQRRFLEECQEALGGNFFKTLVNDLRISFRTLRKAPGFTLVAVGTLALAIGANAVVFGVLNGLVLRPLHVPQAESLYGTVYGDNPGWQSYPNYLDLRDRNRSFEDLAAFQFAFVGVDAGQGPTPETGFQVTGNYFDVLRVQPYLGRFFHKADELGPNSAPYLVLSYVYWHSHFQDDRGVVGRKILVNKHPFTVIGVSRPEFQGTLIFGAPDFFFPIIDDDVEAEGELNVRGSPGGIFEAMGHLKPGVSVAEAQEDVNRVGAYLAKTYPKDFGRQTSKLGRTGLTAFREPLKAFVAGLMALAGLILLAACANLGSLFAARAADRSREVALRLALGSSRNRILRALFTEALLISLAGGAAGLLGSIELLGQLSRWSPFPGTGLRIPVSPDARVYAVALSLAVVSGFLFGVVPVRQVMKTDPYQVVKAGSMGRTGRRITLRDVLLVVQIALCGVLVTSSMVAVRGLMRSLYGNVGFELRNTMLASVNVTMAGYKGEKNITAMQTRMIHAMESIPGIDSAALVDNYPPLVYTAAPRVNIFKEGTSDLRLSNAALRPIWYSVSPGYFHAARTALLAGRDFGWHDDHGAPTCAVVNEEFARKMFGSVREAVGRSYKTQEGARVQVVGVVENGKYQALTEDQQPAMFLSFLQSTSSAAYLLVRSEQNPQQVATAMRSKVRELDGGLPVETETWGSLLSVVQFPARVATMALGVLGTMGAMLSITGIFGMAAYSVSKRMKELGIRIALGAQWNEVLGTALGRALVLLAVGSAMGMILGILASGVLEAIVYQATPRDPMVVAGVIVLMALVGLLATWIPAQRAISLDPMTLLREE